MLMPEGQLESKQLQKIKNVIKKKEVWRLLRRHKHATDEQCEHEQRVGELITLTAAMSRMLK